MNPDSSPKAIAARIRDILGAHAERGAVEAHAHVLRVSEVSLRMTIDDLAPHPTIEVLAAVAVHYGIDPVWLLTGEYDATAHQVAMVEEGANAREEAARILARRLRTTPLSIPAQFRLEA